MQPSPRECDQAQGPGDGNAAFRNGFNRFLGCLYHCLQTNTPTTKRSPSASCFIDRLLSVRGDRLLSVVAADERFVVRPGVQDVAVGLRARM
jgi:hypothetical protein